MFLFLLLPACLFQAPTDDGETPTRVRDSDAAEPGIAVRFRTTDVEIESGVPVDAPAPANATFVRVDSCYDDGTEILCDVWAGGYELHEDGSLVLTPSAWDGALARVTWLVIE